MICKLNLQNQAIKIGKGQNLGCLRVVVNIHHGTIFALHNISQSVLVPVYSVVVLSFESF